MASLCGVCRRLTVDPQARGFEGHVQHFGEELHANVAELQSCAARCEICSVFWACICRSCPPAQLESLLSGEPHRGERRVFIVVDLHGQIPLSISRSKDNLTRVRYSEGAQKIHLRIGRSPLALRLGSLDILAEIGSPAAAQICGRFARRVNDPQFLIQLTEKWLSSCGRHQTCGHAGPRRMPTRVLDIRGATPKLFETNGCDGRYAALSYCWGQGRGIHKIKLRSENYKEFLRSGIDEPGMTMAHRESIQVARMLGFGYIWIDALCIIQGRDKASRDDWALESTKIPQVYGNAALTIVSGRSADSREGFLGPTHVPAVPNTTVHCKLPGPQPGSCIVSLERSQDIGPTDARAWCFQESILSRRMLIFGKEQLSFRCRERVDYEDGNWRLYNDQTEWYDYTIPKDWTLRAEVLRCWYEITMQYSQRDFFDPRDNFAAISGVAQHFQSALRDSGIEPRYLAGLWETDMIRGLLWRGRRLVDENAQPLSRPMGVDETEQGQAISVAPSWSWLSLKGPIAQDIGKPYQPIMPDPTAYSCSPKVPDRWASGHWDPILIRHEEMPQPFKLEVRGRLTKVRVSSIQISQFPFPLKWKDDYGIRAVAKTAVLLERDVGAPLEKVHVGNYDSIIASGMFDLDEDRPTRLWSMLLTFEEGLLLLKNTEGYYKRVGVFKQQFIRTQHEVLEEEEDVVLI